MIAEAARLTERDARAAVSGAIAQVDRRATGIVGTECARTAEQAGRHAGVRRRAAPRAAIATEAIARCAERRRHLTAMIEAEQPVVTAEGRPAAGAARQQRHAALRREIARQAGGADEVGAWLAQPGEDRRGVADAPAGAAPHAAAGHVAALRAALPVERADLAVAQRAHQGRLAGLGQVASGLAREIALVALDRIDAAPGGGRAVDDLAGVDRGALARGEPEQQTDVEREA